MAIAQPWFDKAAGGMPPQIWFAVSAVFHYLGPCFAVLLFPSIGVLGAAWLRIGSAALIFAPWTRPWRTMRLANPHDRLLLAMLGLCLAAMNCSFYLALDRLPVSLVAAVEFVGIIALALHGARSGRNLAALSLAVAGVVLLIDVSWSSDPAGLLWAGLNGLLFVVYIVLGHRLAQSGASDGVAGLGAAMAIAFVCVLPFGLMDVSAIAGQPLLLLAGVGVGLCSSVVPYICDQLAMARLPRASFALMLALLPAVAALAGAAVLAQVPSARDLSGIVLVMAGIALHRPPIAS